LRQKHPVRFICGISGLSESGYYRWKDNAEGTEKERETKQILRKEHARLRGIYGYRRMKILLEKSYGLKHNRKKIYRLLKEMGLQSRIRRKRISYPYIGKGTESHPNILNRMFYAEKPGQKWVTDITVISWNGRRYYLSAILDLYNREVVGSRISPNMGLNIVTDSLKEAIAERNVEGLMIHSDQGGHYTSLAYGGLLKSKGIIQSMSGRGNCLDNAAMENFFGHLKSELIYNTRFETGEQLVKGVSDYIHFYNHERIQEKLNKMAPVEYRSHRLSA
jgi:putative transposase